MSTEYGYPNGTIGCPNPACKPWHPDSACIPDAGLQGRIKWIVDHDAPLTEDQLSKLTVLLRIEDFPHRAGISRQGETGHAVRTRTARKEEVLP